MKRILIIGCAGSGKTTLAKELAKRLHLPAVHLDHLFWKPGWVQRSEDEFDQLLNNALQEELWVMDGNYTRTISHRLHFADTVLFLDYSRWLCTLRVLKRRLLTKEEQAHQCPQKVDWQFLKYVFWEYPHNNRGKTLAQLDSASPTLTHYHFKSPRQLRAWLNSLNVSGDLSVP